jgi:pSer/pThr/pTyr-binding forkhead associated (FHA) protein
VTLAKTRETEDGMIILVPVNDEGEDGAPVSFEQAHVHVGHGPHNDLVLDPDDPATSYEHAMLAVLEGGAIVVCDPTAKPTCIDGVDVTFAPEAERQLKPGDILSFGKGKAIFRVHQIGDAVEPRPRAQPHLRERSPAGGAKRSGRPPPPPPPQGREGAWRVTFQVLSGEQVVREESFCQPLIRIGRMKSSHLLLVDESVSRTHAVVEVTDEGEVLLIDLDSSSGTAVNGARIKKANLKSGDQIDFGKVRALVGYGKVAPSALTAPAPAGAANRRAGAPPPIPADGGFGPPQTQVLSPGDLEAVDGPRLVLRRDDVVEAEYHLTKPQTTIGRLAVSDIQLDDGSVSGRHAMLVAEAGVFLIIDQHSTNGTYVNGQRCTGESLKDGDVIQLGRYELVLVVPHPAGVLPVPKTEILSAEAARAMLGKLGPRGGK